MHQFHLDWLLPSSRCSEKASHLGHGQPRGWSPGLEGLRMPRLDRTHIWKCGAETKQAPFTGCWAVAGSSRDLCSCLQSYSAARGHPSWFLALFAALISVSEAGAALELREQKRRVPSVATPVFPQMHPAKANCSPRPRAGADIACVHTEVRRWDVWCGVQGNRIPPAPPWVQIQPSPPRCAAHPIPFLCPRYPGFASGCLSPCPCHCHGAGSDHIFFYSL